MMKRKIIGLTEKVTVIGIKHKSIVRARIDTGAVLSSIDKKLSEHLDLGPAIRTKIVKSANGKTRRSVVSCTIKMKSQIFHTDVTIADRRHLKYKILIGQNLLSHTDFYIDPKKK